MEKQRRSAQDWQGLVAGWRKSGESAEVFSARHGIRAKTLAWWSSELKRRGSKRSAAALVPVEVVHGPGLDCAVELALGRATLRFERGAAPRYVAAVTRALLEELNGC